MSASTACSAGVPTWRGERFSALHCGAVAVGDDAASALVETEHGQRRNQHGGGEQERRCALVERLHPQPEIKPDAAVDPGDRAGPRTSATSWCGAATQ